MNTWRTRHSVVPRTVLRVMLSAFLTCAGLALPATAHAQLQRLDVFENYSGAIYHRWSYDGGTTWAPWVPVPWTSCGGVVASPAIVGPVSLVSDRPGRLWLAGKSTAGKVMINMFTASTGIWMGWCETGPTSVRGGVTLVTIPPFWCGPFCGPFIWSFYAWNADSFPAITSWGPGRLDLFMHATRYDGAIALLHAWRTSDDDEFTWEELGTGLMQGSPAAVSWGWGRIDVFARGGGSDLSHKYFGGGRWSRWETLGGYITASPAVVSTGPQQLSVYVRGGDGALYHRWFGNGWFGWDYLGGYLVDGVAPAPAARDPYNLDVFVLGTGSSVYKKSYSFGWQDYTYQYLSYTSAITALYWRLT